MPLEFALRPRLSLEPPAPRRRLIRIRLPRFTLPVLAYWLAIAGATHLFIKATAEDSGYDSGKITTSARTAELTLDAPSESAPSEPPSPGSVVPALQLATEPAVTPPPPARDLEPVAAPPPETFVAAAPPPETFVIAPASQTFAAPPPPETFITTPPPKMFAVAARPERKVRQPPVARAEPRVPELAPLFASLEDSAPRRRELPAAAATRGGASTAATSDATRDEPPPTSLPSCESVAASANQSIDLRAARGAPDLTRDAFASVLENGTYLARCALPARTVIEICAAVQNGKTVGVTVTSKPSSPAVNACVRRSVAALRFPANARLDVTRTRFEAAR